MLNSSMIVGHKKAARQFYFVPILILIMLVVAIFLGVGCVYAKEEPYLEFIAEQNIGGILVEKHIDKFNGNIIYISRNGYGNGIAVIAPR